MKISFWSPIHGQSKTSSNICAISIMASMMNKQNNIITESDGHSKSLKYALTGDKNSSRDLAMSNTGVAAVVNYVKSALLSYETLSTCSIALLNGHLNYIPGITHSERKFYDVSSIDSIIANAISSMNQFCDNVFIDVGAFRNSLTLKVARESDIILVCLPQNINLVHNFFERFDSYGLDKDKIIYVIGSYDEKSSYNLKNIMRTFDDINRHNIGVIPYNIEFADYFNNGCVVDFIQRNYACTKNDENYFFISSLKHCVELIFQKAIDRKVI